MIAKLDLVEAEGMSATPVDYKHGAPREGKDGIEMWAADRVQIALQAIVLRENGYACEEAVVFYQKTRQRVRVSVDAALVLEAEDAVARAWELATYGEIPRRWSIRPNVRDALSTPFVCRMRRTV